jgi:hypothetical protein
MVDDRGNLVRVQPLPPEVKKALERKAVSPPQFLAALVGKQGHLMGGAEGAQGFGVQAPIGTVVATTAPTFVWRPLEGATSYRVEVFDASGNEAARGEGLTETRWTPEKPLPPGRVYQWNVFALREGQEIDQAPKPPAPPAKFKVLEATNAAELERARRLYTGSPLTLGVLYAEAGLLDDAEREFDQIVKANPHSEVARRLRNSVRDLRRRGD